MDALKEGPEAHHARVPPTLDAAAPLCTLNDSVENAGTSAGPSARASEGRDGARASETDVSVTETDGNAESAVPPPGTKVSPEGSLAASASGDTASNEATGHEKPSRTLLSVMLERRGSATGQMAAVLEDAAKLVAETTAQSSGGDSAERMCATGIAREDISSIADEMIERRMASLKRQRDGPANPLAVNTCAKQAKLNESHAEVKAVDMSSTFDFHDARFSKMHLKNAPYPAQSLQARFEHMRVVDIADLEDHLCTSQGMARDVVVFGCLVKRHVKKRAKNGRKYVTWTFCNMQTGQGIPSRCVQALSEEKRFTSVNCLLFDDAFEAYSKNIEGAVFAISAPDVLPPRADGAARDTLGPSGKMLESNAPGRERWAGVCLSIAKRANLTYLGTCRDYGLCSKHVVGAGECGAWYNRRLGSYCPRHIAQMYQRASTSMRMDINSQERPGLSLDVMRNGRGPLNMSVHPQDGRYSAGAHRAAAPLWTDNDRVRHKAELAKISRLQVSGRQLHVDPVGALRDRKRPELFSGNRRHYRAAAGGTTLDIPPALASRSRVVAPSEGDTGAMPSQAQYEDAVEVLLRLGFVADEAGALHPPHTEQPTPYALKLVRGAPGGSAKELALRSPAKSTAPKTSDGPRSLQKRAPRRTAPATLVEIRARRAALERSGSSTRMQHRSSHSSVRASLGGVARTAGPNPTVASVLQEAEQPASGFRESEAHAAMQQDTRPGSVCPPLCLGARGDGIVELDEDSD